MVKTLVRSANRLSELTEKLRTVAPAEGNEREWRRLAVLMDMILHAAHKQEVIPLEWIEEAKRLNAQLGV